MKSWSLVFFFPFLIHEDITSVITLLKPTQWIKYSKMTIVSLPTEVGFGDDWEDTTREVIPKGDTPKVAITSNKDVYNKTFSSDNHVKGKRGEACYDKAKDIAKRCMPGLKVYNLFKDNQQHSRPDRIDVFYYKHQRIGILAAEIHNHAQHYISSHEWVEENDLNKFDGVQADKKVSAGSFRYGQKSKERMKRKRIDCWDVLPDQILSDDDIKGMAIFLAAMITAWILEATRENIEQQSRNQLSPSYPLGVYNRFFIPTNHSCARWLEEVGDG